jgi:two-component system, NarL family, sensor kinase
MTLRIIYLSIVIGLCQASRVQSQQHATDSLENLIRTLPNDTSKVNRLIDLTRKVVSESPTKAVQAISQAIALAKKINYSFGLSAAYGFKATVLFYQMKLDSSKLFVDKAYALVHKNTDSRSRNLTANLINKYASIYQQRQKYDSSILFYLEAARIFTETKDEAKVIYSYYNISGIYNSLENYEKAIFYARETQQIALKTKNPEYIIRSLMALADAFVVGLRYDSILTISKNGLNLAVKNNMPFAVGKFHSLLGIYYTKKAVEYDSAIFHFKLALAEYTKINIPYDIALLLNSMGHSYLKMKDYPNAITYLKQALELSQQLKLNQVRQLSLMDLSNAKEGQGHLDESLKYLKEYIKVSDTLQIKNNQKVVSDLEAKYQTAKKEELLQFQQKIISQKNVLNYILGAVAFSVLVISYLLYTTYKQKQTLQERQITQLQNEKLLLASESILKGQEGERSRMAQDLHDGLGGMLSSIKLTLSSMKGNIILTEDNARLFTKAFEQLDSSIGEMRRVAHNMMPEALVKFGLPLRIMEQALILR